jgi:hypothetical protein
MRRRRALVSSLSRHVFCNPSTTLFSCVRVPSKSRLQITRTPTRTRKHVMLMFDLGLVVNLVCPNSPRVGCVTRFVLRSHSPLARLWPLESASWMHHTNNVKVTANRTLPRRHSKSQREGEDRDIGEMETSSVQTMHARSDASLPTRVLEHHGFAIV